MNICPMLLAFLCLLNKDWFHLKKQFWVLECELRYWSVTLEMFQRCILTYVEAGSDDGMREKDCHQI